MGLSLLQAPSDKPVSLADAKAQCRVDGSDEDALITRLIGMATEQAEARTGRALMSQRLRYTLDAFPFDTLDLPCPPLVSVQEISYLDTTGQRVTLANTEYDVVTDEIIGRVLPGWGKSWPACRTAPGSVRIDFTAGYANAAAVPESIRSWILLSIATLYAQREALASNQLVEIPHAFWEGLLDGYRVWRAA